MITNNSTAKNELNTKEGVIKDLQSPAFVYQHFLSIRSTFDFYCFYFSKKQICKLNWSRGCGCGPNTDVSVAGQHHCRTLGCLPVLTGHCWLQMWPGSPQPCSAKPKKSMTGPQAGISRTILHNATLRSKRKWCPRSELLTSKPKGIRRLILN